MTVGRDRFDTPVHVTELMVNAISLRHVSIAADFAAGGGGLLDPVLRMWPSAKLVAIDVCSRAIRSLRRRRSAWSIHRMDFLHEIQRAKCKSLEALRGSIDVVLLNPPFSCRGASIREIKADGEMFSCSEAMAFVLTSLPYLAEHGQLIAVLPNGTLSNEKDQSAWSFVRKSYRLEVVGTNGRKTFPGCHARTTVVRLSPCRTDATPRALIRSRPRAISPQVQVAVVRGSIQMHQIPSGPNAGKIVLVHSSDLTENKMASSRKICTVRSIARGPAVLLPRVGVPDRRKIALVTSREIMALSDCVISLGCNTVADATRVQQNMISNWNGLSALYGGTCAPYLTIENLRRFLNRCGIKTGDGLKPSVAQAARRR